MLSSIHPLGERARHNRWGVTVAAYTIAAALSGATVGAALGWVGSILPLGESAQRWGLVLVALAAAVLDLARVPAPGPKRQVNERWIGQYRGWVYGAGFGAQLGLGMATYVVSWGVLATYAAALLTADPAAGAVVGLAFGLGRALAPLAAGWVDRPTRLTAFHRQMARLGPKVRIGAVTVFALAAFLGLVF